MERLDAFSKILIATGQINFMASNIFDVNREMKLTGLANKSTHKYSIQEKDELLNDVVKRLALIMEDMGNLINNHGCGCNIDERISKVPFEVLVLEMDEVDNDYEEDDIDDETGN